MNKLNWVFKKQLISKKTCESVNLKQSELQYGNETTAAKRQSYTVSDKLRIIIQFAEQNGNRAAEPEFCVSESNVRLWWKSEENLEEMPWLKRANRGKRAAWPELEINLLAWITEKRNNGLAILPSLVRLKALELVKDETFNIPEGIQGWKSLVSMLHEEECSVTLTKSNLGTTSSSRLRGGDCNIPSLYHWSP